MIRSTLIFLLALVLCGPAWSQEEPSAGETVQPSADTPEVQATTDAASAGKPGHEGYYYPAITSKETYVARARRNEEIKRDNRIRFVTELTALQSRAAYAPQYAVFAKGSDGQKLIIVALNDEVFGSLYRARGVLAQLTAFSRRTPFFVENSVDDIFTFFDLLRYLGFERLTISDGKTFSHQVDFE